MPHQAVDNIDLDVYDVELNCEIHFWCDDNDVKLLKLSYYDETPEEHDISFMIPQLKSVILTKLDIPHDED